MRSARGIALGRGLGTFIAAGACCAALSACATTQQEAARLQLNAARVRASQVPARIVRGETSAVVRLASLRILGDAFVATVRNTSDSALDDLPISVGYVTRAGRSVVLNSTSELYSGNHLPLLLAGHTVVWLDSVGRRPPKGSRPFALVGRDPSPPAAVGSQLPQIAVEHVRRGTSDGFVTLSLINETSVPQYQMPIYAFGTAGGRVTAAGTVFITHLGSHATQDLRIPLVGRLGRAALRVEALPTIFH